METPAADVGPEPTATGEMTTLFYKSISSSAAKINKKHIGVAAEMQLPFYVKKRRLTLVVDAKTPDYLH